MLDLVIYPDDRLHLQSAPVESISKEIAELAREMVETMRAAGGVGLAGVQVGRLERIFVLQVPEQDPQVFINPEIVNFSDKVATFEEGCLSIPGVYADVLRPAAVEINFFDETGRKKNLTTDGYLARIIQHEYDHLGGTLFYERMKSGAARRLLKAYEKRKGSEQE